MHVINNAAETEDEARNFPHQGEGYFTYFHIRCRTISRHGRWYFISGIIGVFRIGGIAHHGIHQGGCIRSHACCTFFRLPLPYS